MLAKYGVTQYLDGNGTDGSTYNIALAPLWYARSGVYYIYHAKLNNAGTYSYSWSRSSYSNTVNAYRLYFNTGVYPSNYYDRYYGFSLRCLHQP